MQNGSNPNKKGFPMKRSKHAKRRNRRRNRPSEAARTQLYLEALEDRMMLSSGLVSGLESLDPVNAYTVLKTDVPATSAESAPSESVNDGDGAPYALPDTFKLHSCPTATKVIYLDFDGHTAQGQGWKEVSRQDSSFVMCPFSFDGDSATFSDDELERIQRIWERVCEDFRPFDVDVTTEDPGVDALRKAGDGDERWGVRVVIGNPPHVQGPYSGGVGEAWMSSFTFAYDIPAFVYQLPCGNGNERMTAEVISHEVGHTLGLRHAGAMPNGTGPTGWAPIMSACWHGHQLQQWADGSTGGSQEATQKGELEIITSQNGFGYRKDDHGDSRDAATALTVADDAVSAQGIVERNTDVDYFTFTTDGGWVNIRIHPFHRGPNLDVLANLYDSSGQLLASSNPLDALDAHILEEVDAGTYYLSVDGTGKLGAYPDYGSLGSYTIRGSLGGECPPRVSITDATVKEGDTGQTWAAFTVTLAEPAKETFMIRYATSEGSALADKDYIESSACITFLPGETAQTFVIPVKGDVTIEPDEAFFVNLYGPDEVKLVRDRGCCTIQNDDSGVPPTIKSLRVVAHPEYGGNHILWTAEGVDDPDENGYVDRIDVYRETNGRAGLQTGEDGDEHISGGGGQEGATWQGWAPIRDWDLGTHTIYGVATDNQGLTGPPTTTTYTRDKWVSELGDPVIVSVNTTADRMPGTGEGVTVSAHGVSDSDGTVSEVRFYLETNGVAGLQTGQGGDHLGMVDNDGSDGWTCRIDQFPQPGVYRFYVQAVDDQGHTSAPGMDALSVTVTAPDAAPTVGSLTATPDHVTGPSDVVTLVAGGVSDPDGQVASVKFYLEGNGTAGLQTGQGGDPLVYTDTNGADGWACQGNGMQGTGKVYTYYAQAVDPYGSASAAGTAAPSATVTVQAPEPKTYTVTIGHHADAEARGWTWVDVDQDVLTPVFTGRNGYAVLEFDTNHVLNGITLHGTDSRTSFALKVKQAKAGDGRVEIGQVISSAQASLNRLDLSCVTWAGAGIDINGVVKDLRLGDVADNVDLKFAGGLKDRMRISAGAIGQGVDLTFGGELSQVRAAGWAGGSIHVANVGTIDIRGGDCGADLKIDASNNPNGGFRTIRVTGGDFTGSVDVPGKGGSISVRSDRTGNGGNIAGSFSLGQGIRSIDARGGNINLADLTVAAGNVSLRASEARAADGTYRGGSITIAGNAKVAGRTQIDARGGSIRIDNLAAGGDTRLSASASRTQANTGNIAAKLALTGGRSHRVDARGGNVTLSSLDVAHGNVWIAAGELRGAGGSVTVSQVNVADGRLTVQARGGNANVNGTVANNTRLSASASRTQADTGNISAKLALTGGRSHRVDARGGNVNLSGLDVAHGNVWIGAGELRGAGGSVTVSQMTVADGALTVQARGGNANVNGTMANNTRLSASASRTQAKTGNITAGLTITGGRNHQVSSRGGNVHFTSLNVSAAPGARLGSVRISAMEARIGKAYQGGHIRFDGGKVQARTAIDARGGDIRVDALLSVLGDVSRLSATKSRTGAGGRLVAAADSGKVDLDIKGVLRSLRAEHLMMDIKADSLARAVLRADRISGGAGAGARGTLRVNDHSGSARALNGTIRMKDSSGAVHV